MTLRALARRFLPPRAREGLRSAAARGSASVDRMLEFVGRRGLRVWRSIILRPRAGMDIAMLCVRKPRYVGMAVSSINSLHYRNPSCRVLLHLDNACCDSFRDEKKRLDYPGRVEPLLAGAEPSTPWQFIKLDVVLAMSARGIPFVDADSRWHADPWPLIARDRAMFLVEVNRFSAIGLERALLSEGLGHPEWINFRHFNTGFVSIPAPLATDQFALESRSLARRIYAASDVVGPASEQSWRLRHLCEELALSLAAQAVIGPDRIVTLKGSDGPGNRNLLESFYFGALHAVD